MLTVCLCFWHKSQDIMKYWCYWKTGFGFFLPFKFCIGCLVEWWNFTVTSDLFFILQNLTVHFKCLTLFCVFTMLIILFYDFLSFPWWCFFFPLIWILSYSAAHLLTFRLRLDVQQSFIHSFLSYMHLSSTCVTYLSFDISTLSPIIVLGLPSGCLLDIFALWWSLIVCHIQCISILLCTYFDLHFFYYRPVYFKI